MQIDKAYFQQRIEYWLDHAGKGEIEDATDRQIYEAVGKSLVDCLWKQWKTTEKQVQSRKLKQVFYLSVEFLIGRSLENNLLNMGLLEECRQVLDSIGIDFQAIAEREPDAGLGSGGLGRLAACFLDSLAALSLPGRGYGIRYRYGMFQQHIVDNRQMERPDGWNCDLDPWSVRRDELEIHVVFGGGDQETEIVRAIPFDFPVIGWETDTVLTLRLWDAQSPDGFDLHQFNNMEPLSAIEKQNKARNLSRILYPDDSRPEGKKLRFRQQYFFSSASLQDILREYKKHYGQDLTQLPEKIAVQLNDTHPVIAIPELMRLLIDKERLSWESAWNMCKKIFAYTNHTVMQEALEQWSVELIRWECPRILQIIEKINQQLLDTLDNEFGLENSQKEAMSIIGYGMVRMANLACYASYSVNGVAALHTEILKTSVLKDWFSVWPNKFNNKTNGVTPRRWIKKSNPKLANLLDETLGTGWVNDLMQLKKLESLADNSDVLEKLGSIKLANKERLANFIQQKSGIAVSPNSLFDVQIKRLHEYKRQLLNILSVIYDWHMIKSGQSYDLPFRTVIFSAKAAASYHMAKAIIHLIHAVADRINKDSQCSELIKVVFIPNYSVSVAEMIIPAAELSQQISTAGKEASGTGNIKLMMNGALTLGTMDGANVEIVESVGRENAFIFGMTAEETYELSQSHSYDPQHIVNSDSLLQRTLDSLIDGTFSQAGDMHDLRNSLLGYGTDSDPYFVVADFAAYQKARSAGSQIWKDTSRWNRMSLLNIARSGQFSSDRTITQYSQDIWKLKKL